MWKWIFLVIVILFQIILLPVKSYCPFDYGPLIMSSTDIYIYSYQYSNCGTITSLIESTVISIGDYAFQGCYSLSEVTLSTGLLEIGISAFDMSSIYFYSSLLKTLTISSTVTSIGDKAFYYCSALTKIVLTSGLTVIGPGTGIFYYTNVTSLSIPSTVTTIGDLAFSSSNYLSKLTLTFGLTVIGGSMFLSYYKAALVTVTIPSSVASIGDNAFLYISSLTHVTLIPGLTVLGKSMFDSSYLLRTVTIPSSVTSIGDGVFQYCYSLDRVTLTSGLTSIGFEMFKYANISSIMIPASIMSIGYQAFSYNSALICIYYGNYLDIYNILDGSPNAKQCSYSPTSEPSLLPSLQPIFRPSSQPSKQPTVQPSLQPYLLPITNPSLQPTYKPSVQPTTIPSLQPTLMPSNPSSRPSCKPSYQPNIFPTLQPSIHPSIQPSIQPFMVPSSKPTEHPTLQPSFDPTILPSSRPSSLPSEQPSEQPSYHPSNYPTQQPIIHPTCNPSNQPSRKPSKQPSIQPTIKPTVQPTIKPSVQPIMKPSNQPTVWPSSQPTIKPSSQPTSKPSLKPSSQPTSQPTKKPSLQPSYEPSNQPSSQPSRSPTNQPSILPSAQPSLEPSLQPSSEPSEIPSLKPTIQPTTHPTSRPLLNPTSHPSRQPSRYPSSRPSSNPTINKLNCFGTTFYSFRNNRCIPCPHNSNNTMKGAATCTCNEGYYQRDSGASLRCYPCPSGHYSRRASTNCTSCPAGRYAFKIATKNCSVSLPGFYSLQGSNISYACPAGRFSTAGSSSCSLCSLGSFSSSSGSSSCQLCPLNFYSDILGASNCQQCGAGITGKTGSTDSSECVDVTPNFTQGFLAIALVLIVFYFYIIKGGFHRTSFSRREKFVIPVAKSCVKIESLIRLNYVFKTEQEMASENKISSHIKVFIFLGSSLILISLLSLTGLVILFANVFFNSFIIFRGLRLFVNLPPFVDSIKSWIKSFSFYFSIPADVLNTLLFPIIFIYDKIGNISLDLKALSVTCEGAKAPIQLFVNTIILGMAIVFIASDSQILWRVSYPLVNMAYLGNVLNKDYAYLNPTFYLCILVIIVNALNPIQSLLRFLMSFVTISDFGANNGAHAVSSACDTMSTTPYFDSILGYLSTILAYLFILPVIYIIAEVIVPRRYNTVSVSNQLTKSVKESLNKLKRKQRSSSIADSSNLTMNNISNKEIKKQEKTSRFKVFTQFCLVIFKKITMFFSFEIWLAKLSEFWVIHLSSKFNADLDEFFLDVEAKSTTNRVIDKRTSHIDNLQLSIENFSKKSQVFSSQKFSSIKSFSESSKNLLTAVVNINEREMSEQEIMDEFWTKTLDINLPTYFNLCSIVQNELNQWFLKYCCFSIITVPFSYFLAYTSIGHILSKLGRREWARVRFRYFLFLQVCFGIWTEKAAVAYGLDSVASSMTGNKNMTAIVTVLVGTRAILFQVAPILAPLSVAIIMTCGSPLFLFGEKMMKRLPPLIIYNPYEISLKRECDLYGSHFSKEFIENNYKWSIYLRSILIFYTEARLPRFLCNAIVVSISILFLFSLDPTTPLVIFIFVGLLLPFALCKCLGYVILVGKGLYLKDSDFTNVFYPKNEYDDDEIKENIDLNKKTNDEINLKVENPENNNLTNISNNNIDNRSEQIEISNIRDSDSNSNNNSDSNEAESEEESEERDSEEESDEDSQTNNIIKSDRRNGVLLKSNNNNNNNNNNNDSDYDSKSSSEDDDGDEDLQINIISSNRRNAAILISDNDNNNNNDDNNSESNESSSEDEELQIRVISSNRRNAVPSTINNNNNDSDSSDDE